MESKTKITPQDLRDAWRGIGQTQALGLCGVSRRTWRRWLAGEARIPRSAYELGRVLTGEMSVFGEAWRSWRIVRGALYDATGTAHTPAAIAAWWWTAQRLQALRAEENKLDTDSSGKVVSLRTAHRLTAELDARLSRRSRSS